MVEILMIPPLNYDEAQKFCCCQPYEDYHICIYAGGGSAADHDMYWGFIIYDAEGMRRHNGQLPDTCLDVDDGIDHCQQIIDGWNRGVTYEDIFLWRAVCEYLWLTKDKHSHFNPTSPDEILGIIPSCQHLVGLDRTHRQMLWDAYKIQLITWTKVNKRVEGWCLKGNWEDKIWFLEQVYILGLNPNTLPRTWLEKWERKQRQAQLQALDKKLKDVVWAIDHFKMFMESKHRDEEYLCHILQEIVRLSREAKEGIVVNFMDLKNQ
jgi:hypothetical protein